MRAVVAHVHRVPVDGRESRRLRVVLWVLALLDGANVVLNIVEGDLGGVVAYVTALIAVGIALLAVNRWDMWREVATSPRPPPIGLN